MTRVVVMGVSGSGKSTIGSLLAERLGVPFIDADSLHPPANVAKMASGHPLTDEDRWPWLALVAHALDAGPTVVACSALKRSYRDVLRRDGDTFFAHLAPPPDVIADRMTRRTDHFMPPGLLPTQLAALEPLESDERGLVVGSTGDAAAIVNRIFAEI